MQIRSKSQRSLHNNATKKTWDITDLAASSARATGRTICPAQLGTSGPCRSAVLLLPALPIPAKPAVLESKYKLNILAKPDR